MSKSLHKGTCIHVQHFFCYCWFEFSMIVSIFAFVGLAFLHSDAPAACDCSIRKINENFISIGGFSYDFSNRYQPRWQDQHFSVCVNIKNKNIIDGETVSSLTDYD